MNVLSQISHYYEIDKEKIYGRHHSSHLIQTAKLLKKHECRKEVVEAGLLHSIYDTHSIYHNQGVPLQDREIIISLSNKKTEELVYFYSYAHVIENYQNIFCPPSNGEKLYFPEQLINDLSDIIVCDMLEQIIWCVDKKRIFTYQDAYNHLNKLTPIMPYCKINIREHYQYYWCKSIL
ncbi:DUF6817 domain-containing protein [Xenorhabdus sp. IM139775]|uniref:DUF6817 domain-containing protein n=1 Tax=Xenorhabdus sp. IM139775 TaxID=3025876 RepID=UPI002359D42A|nr:hypothetical protein [Xenorhabdus sp. IM139775]MDC9594072.1 hypothetical protein [Xenorhabdus sp. IM139775]